MPEKKPETKLTVRFLADAEIKNGAGAVVESYRAGEVYALRIDRARRWIKRSMAVEHRASEAPAAAPRGAIAQVEIGRVEIAKDWRARSWRQQCTIASALTGRSIAKAAEARAIIEAEEARRAAPVSSAPDSAADDAGFAAAQGAHRQKEFDNEDGA